MRAQYSYTVEQGVVCVVDANDGGRTVTNDAEHVVEDLVRAGVVTAAESVVYCDTEGRWDVILVEEGRFAGFAPIGALTRDHAVAEVRAGLLDAVVST
jgi:hypothetical protein